MICQGDIVKIQGYQGARFVVVSKNAYIRATNMLHVCPLLPDVEEGPIHIVSSGMNGESGTAICEAVKLIDPSARGIQTIDRLPYTQIMEISDTIQGIFEYD